MTHADRLEAFNRASHFPTTPEMTPADTFEALNPDCFDDLEEHPFRNAISPLEAVIYGLFIAILFSCIGPNL